MTVFSVTRPRRLKITSAGAATVLVETNADLKQRAESFKEGDWVLLNGDEHGKILKKGISNFFVQPYTPEVNKNKRTKVGHPKWYGVSALSKPDS